MENLRGVSILLCDLASNHTLSVYATIIISLFITTDKICLSQNGNKFLPFHVCVIY
jgi:hypothetical protein